MPALFMAHCFSVDIVGVTRLSLIESIIRDRTAREMISL